MKKVLFIILKVFLIVLTSIATICAIFICSCSCLETFEVSNNAINLNWMSYLEDDKYITDVIIPGSHDSGTYKMPWVGATQYGSIAQQLDSGTRYFDIRVNQVKENTYKIYHGPVIGIDFDPIMDDIKDFLENNPTEFLILDFQHFENNSQDHVHGVVYEKLTDKLVYRDYYYDTSLEDISHLKVKDVRGKAIVLFGYDYNEEAPRFVFSRNNDEGTKLNCALDSYYFTERNSKDSETYINESLPYYLSLIKDKINKEGQKGLFVLQGQLTDSALVFGPYSKERTHSKNMSNYINNLKSNADFKYINIIMRDFINETKCNEIYTLNEELESYKF